MKTFEQEPSVTVVEIQWALGFLSKAFKELAVAYSRRDRPGAIKMLDAINADMAGALIQARKEFPKGVADASLHRIAAALRETLLAAEQQIEDAAKPH